MNALQRKELELFQAFLQVCRQLGLSYYLICGSALGAVKYRGFIPWDDDMDLAMLRPEYEVFLAQAPDLLPAHIFLQNYKTDPAFPAIYSKLRYSGTAYIEKAARKLAMHHGIFIDLFPLDGYPAEPAGSVGWSGGNGTFAGLWRRRFPAHPRYPGAFTACWAVIDVHLPLLRRMSGSLPSILLRTAPCWPTTAIGRARGTMRPGRNLARELWHSLSSFRCDCLRTMTPTSGANTETIGKIRRHPGR